MLENFNVKEVKSIYLSRTGKTVSKKKVEHLDCKCKYKRTSSLSKDDRKSLMMYFYSLDENGKKTLYFAKL